MMHILSASGSNDIPAVLHSLDGTAHTSELLAAGVHPRRLYAARDDGILIEASRGIFRLASLPLTEPDLLAVATRMPRAVLCLITPQTLPTHELRNALG